MNIGFVATEIGHQEGGAFMGGNVNNVVSVSKALAERGHEIKIITTKPRDAAKNYTEPITWAEVYSLDCDFDHGSPGYLFSFSKYSVSCVRKLMKKDELDVLSIHAGFTIWGLIGSIGSQLGCPSVHAQYCPIDQESGSFVYDVIQSEALSRLWLSGNNQLIAVTDNVADSVSSLGSTRTIHNGLDTKKYSPAAADRFNLFETESPIIGYLGSLNEQKGLDILVDSFQTLSSDAKLALGLEVRSKRSDSKLWRRIENDPDIYPFGIIEDIPAFLARTDVFAVPFRTTVGPADYPVAALEAMSCATPVVASQVGGLPDLVDHEENGLLLKEATAEQLSEALTELLENPELRDRLGAQARQRIEEDFAMTTIVDQYERMFEEVANQ